MKKINLLTSIFVAIFAVTAFAQEAQLEVLDGADPTRFFNIAQIQVLNKTTAKTSLLEIRSGDKVKFGSIYISVKKCWQAPLDQRPESKILIDVSEIKLDDKEEEKTARIFYGWIFASSPSLSGLEHPIYDIVAMGCKNK